MKTKISTILLAFLALAVNIHAATSLPAPMPTFMDKDQIAQWNADGSGLTGAEFNAGNVGINLAWAAQKAEQDSSVSITFTISE